MSGPGRRETMTKGSMEQTNKLPTLRSKGQLINSPFKPQQLLGSQNSNSQPQPIITINPFQKSLFGDVFGTRSLGDSRSMLGILYRARVQESVHIKKKEKSHDEAIADTAANLVGSQTSVVDIMESDSDEDNDVHSEMNSRLQLAMTLRNWSSIEENNDFIIHEGGVHALIALAGTDDQAIRKCVASAFYHLSCRKGNRQELITLGGAQGVISIATQGLRSWKIAKLCAWTLCNLSMEEDSQAMAIMAQEGAITALGILFGLRQQRLLPVCVQALYNLTCAEHFKGMERILKSLINIPQTGFDSSYFLVKALVNCCRFYWMRSRIIEDGALASLVSFVASIPQRNNIDECVVLVATCLRLLSESSTSSSTTQSSSSNQSSQIRVDMVSKGSIELINTLMQYCDERSWEHNAVTLFNLLHIPAQQFPAATLETAVNIITDIITSDKVNENTLLTCAACIFMAIRDPSRFVDRPAIPLRISTGMPIVLASANALTKYFAIASAGYLFFSQHLKTIVNMEPLITRFVEAGPMTLTDDKSAHVFALYLARLAEDGAYMNTLATAGLLPTIIELLLQLVKEKKRDMVVQESACIGVVRIALMLKEMPPQLPRQISEMMFDLLSLRDIFVLRNAICGIRCLGEFGLCHNELLSDAFLERVAGIVVRYHDDPILVENCLAVLAVFSFDDQSHNGLAVDSVLTVLFKAAASEKNNGTRSLVATTLCNISVDETVRAKMVTMGVVQVLGNLSGATSELIQELCAKCICNITASVHLHSAIIKQGILQTLLMISLVRAVANTTKQLCARALLNLLEDANIEALKAAGAVRVFATLSAIDNLPIQNICARAFLIFTGNEQMREDIVTRLPVIHAIFGMVKCSSLRVNVMVGLAICNLLVCPHCQKAAIHAGGLSVLKIIAAMDVDELTEATARVIVNLILETSLHPNLLREPLVPVLVLFLQHPSRTAFECSLHALSCMAQYDIFHNMMIDKGCVTALVGALMSGRISTHSLAAEVCRTLCLLSYDQRRTEAMLVHGNIMIAPHVIYRNGTCTAQAATMIAMLFRNLSYDKAMYKHIMDQDVLRLLKCLYTDFKSECAGVCRSAIIFMNNIAHEPSLHQQLLKQGLMSMMLAVVTTAVEHGKKQLHRLHHHGGHGAHGHGHGHGHSSGHNSHASSPDKQQLQQQHMHSHSKTFVDHSHHHHGHAPISPPLTGSPPAGHHHRHSTAGISSSRVGSPQNSFDTEYLDDSHLHDEARFDPNHTKYLILTKRDIYFMARTLNLVSSSASCHDAIVEGNAVQICNHLLIFDSDTASHFRHEVASGLCALSSSKGCRKTLVDQGASELLVMLARSATNRETQAKCALALGYLSEITRVSKDVVGTLLLLNLKNEELQEAMMEESAAAEAAREAIEDGRKHHHKHHHHSAGGVGGGSGTGENANSGESHAEHHNESSAGAGGDRSGGGASDNNNDNGNNGNNNNGGSNNDLIGGGPGGRRIPGSPQQPGSRFGESGSGAGGGSGPKTLRSMIKDGLLHRRENHSIVVEEGVVGGQGHHHHHSHHHRRHSRSSSPVDMLTMQQQQQQGQNMSIDHHHHHHDVIPSVNEVGPGASKHHVPELKITAIEARILQGHYNVFKFGTITLTSTPQPAGMTGKASLGSLYMTQPSISAERNLEPPDRLEKLRVIIKSWAFIKEPLPKETGQQGEYIVTDDIIPGSNTPGGEGGEHFFGAGAAGGSGSGVGGSGGALAKYRRNKSMINSPRGGSGSARPNPLLTNRRSPSPVNPPLTAAGGAGAGPTGGGSSSVGGTPTGAANASAGASASERVGSAGSNHGAGVGGAAGVAKQLSSHNSKMQLKNPGQPGRSNSPDTTPTSSSMQATSNSVNITSQSLPSSTTAMVGASPRTSSRLT